MLRDDLDRAIVASLQADARTSYRAIGAAIGLSASAVKRRVDRLERDGVIVGYRAVVVERRENGVEAIVELWCRPSASPERIAELLRSSPHVLSAYTVTGDADAFVHVRAADGAELETVVESIRSHPLVDRTRTSIVMARLIDR